jgi:molybdopterin synthase catalytic subunit
MGELIDSLNPLNPLNPLNSLDSLDSLDSLHSLHSSIPSMLRLACYTDPMSLPRLAIVRDALSVEALSGLVEAEARSQGEGCGATCAFVGVVRATHQGRRVRHLEYEAFEPLALRVFARIESEIAEEWPGIVVAIHHRVGSLAIGEASVVIVAGAAHRAEAFQACRYAIERVKQIAPVWKHEFFEDGDAWVEGAIADPDDAEARRTALETACA